MGSLLSENENISDAIVVSNDISLPEDGLNDSNIDAVDSGYCCS